MEHPIVKVGRTILSGSNIGGPSGVPMSIRLPCLQDSDFFGMCLIRISCNLGVPFGEVRIGMPSASRISRAQASHIRPQALSINPMVTPSACLSRCPKWYPTTRNFAAVPGVQIPSLHQSRIAEPVFEMPNSGIESLVPSPRDLEIPPSEALGPIACLTSRTDPNLARQHP